MFIFSSFIDSSFRNDKFHFQEKTELILLLKMELVVPKGKSEGIQKFINYLPVVPGVVVTFVVAAVVAVDGHGGKISKPQNRQF